jgi:hypothetical protein
MRWRKRPRTGASHTLDRPLLLRGHLWVGDGNEYDDGSLLVGVDGCVVACGARDDVMAPDDAEVVDAAWIGPGLVDEHVHLAFGDPLEMLAAGVVAVRDLGAPPADAVRWRRLTVPRVEVAGPLLTAPGGYPSRGWGEAGFAAFLDDAEQATRLVEGLVGQVDVIKLALEPRGGPVPSPAVASAVVGAAHAAGKPVTAHALTVAMVERALDAGVDELAHMPVEVLPASLVGRVATAGTRVVSTMQTLLRDASSTGVHTNAKALVAAGVDVRYGTDLGNAGTRPGADPDELRLLADAGLGSEGALRAGTHPVVVGAPAGAVALSADPRVDPIVWRRPVAVVCGQTALVQRGQAD